MEKPSKVDIYNDNLANFVLSLPKSKLRFLFFNCIPNGKCEPCLNFRVRAWHNPSLTSTPVYISPAGDSNFIYVYRDTQIKYRVEYDQNTRKVVGFEPLTMTKSYSPFQKGGAFLTAYWGDHLTVGIKDTRYHLLLKNHLTRYDVDPKDPTQTSYIRDATYCDVDLEKPIDSNSKCIQSGMVTPLTLNFYKQIPNPDPHVLPILQELVKVIKNDPTYTAAGGSLVEYTTFKGRRHRLHQGSKGGRYVISKGQKVYIKQKGGNVNPSMYQDEGFSGLFMSFIKETRIDPIAAIQEARVNAEVKGELLLSEVEIIDDEESDYMMILYHHMITDDIMAKTRIFAIEKRLMLPAFEVYQIPVAERTLEQQTTYNAFAVDYQPIPVRMIESIA